MANKCDEKANIEIFSKFESCMDIYYNKRNHK